MCSEIPPRYLCISLPSFLSPSFSIFIFLFLSLLSFKSLNCNSIIFKILFSFSSIKIFIDVISYIKNYCIIYISTIFMKSSIYYEFIQAQVSECCTRMLCMRYLDNNVIDNLHGQASEMILGGTKITIQWMIHRASGSLLNHIARRHASRATTCTCDVYTAHIGAAKGMRDGAHPRMWNREKKESIDRNYVCQN